MIFYMMYFVLGLLIGSFLNVVIYRLPRMLEQQWKEECIQLFQLPAAQAQTTTSLNLCLPASHCPQCQKPLSWFENIPLFSFLFLKGRCRFCQTRISLQYPLVEVVTALLFVLCAWRFGVENELWLLAGFVFFSYLIALSVIDWQTQLLPDQLTLSLLWLGLLLNWHGGFVSLNDAVLGAAFGYISLWLVYWGFKIATGKEGLGYGDFKLLAALGAWVGWQLLPLIILLGSLIGAVVGITQMIRLKRGKEIPFAFGPYLAMAGGIVLLFGKQIMNAYLQFYY